MRGDDISNVVSSPSFHLLPDDVRLMAETLALAQKSGSETSFDLSNCGTAMRFLTAFFAAQPGRVTTLTGSERMLQRPIGQLVDALRELGATIDYLGEEGCPPLRIKGNRLAEKPIVVNDPLSTQFISALMLVGVKVQTNSTSPYLALTREVLKSFRSGHLSALDEVERDWSSAAFWLERQVILQSRGEDVHYTFPGLSDTSVQGDKIAKPLFDAIADRSITEWDFASCPDLYPAAAVACHELNLNPVFTGLESLRIKESDRIAAVEENFRRIERKELPLCSFGDHRIAMAFLAAGYPVDNEDCVSKSYPDYVLQLRGITRVVPQKGVNDDNLGKKHALKKLIGKVESDYVWLSDDDIVYPLSCPSSEQLAAADMLILPLRMCSPKSSLVSRLQMIEYAAIQALTIREAKKGKPIMCSGANMIVRREAWLICKDDLHDELPSGDDMFLLEAMKRRGMRVRVLDDSCYEAVCTAKPTLRDLLLQRMRWAGKAVAYKDKDIIQYGVITLLSNIFVVLCPPWLLVKWIHDMRLVSSRLSAFDLGVSGFRFWMEGLFLTIVYPWYMIVCLAGGFFRRKKW